MVLVVPPENVLPQQRLSPDFDIGVYGQAIAAVEAPVHRLTDGWYKEGVSAMRQL